MIHFRKLVFSLGSNVYQQVSESPIRGKSSDLKWRCYGLYVWLPVNTRGCWAIVLYYNAQIKCKASHASVFSLCNVPITRSPARLCLLIINILQGYHIWRRGYSHLWSNLDTDVNHWAVLQRGVAYALMRNLLRPENTGAGPMGRLLKNSFLFEAMWNRTNKEV